MYLCFRNSSESTSKSQNLKGRSKRIFYYRKIHLEINKNLAAANKTMKELKPLIKEVNEDYEKDSQEGDKSNLVQCKSVTVEANDAIKALKEIEEKFSDALKSDLQRHYVLLKGEQLS